MASEDMFLFFVCDRFSDYVIFNKKNNEAYSINI